jgi:hypothetical protein
MLEYDVSEPCPLIISCKASLFGQWVMAPRCPNAVPRNQALATRLHPLTLRMASKNMKKMALLSPLDKARGPTPRKKGRHPPPSATTLRTA